MRRAAKIDANQGQITTALKQAGATVKSLAAVGEGFPDLVVGFRDRNLLMEVKQPKGKLTAQQLDLISSWRGLIHVVTTAEEALAALEAAQ